MSILLLTSAAATEWARACCIGRLSSERPAAYVEENTDGVITVICENNVEFAVTINIGCFHRSWVTACWIGRLSSERPAAYVEENTDGVIIVICDNNVEFAVAIDIGCFHRKRTRASWIGCLSSECNTPLTYRENENCGAHTCYYRAVI